MADQAAGLSPGMRVQGLVHGAVTEILDLTPVGSSTLVRYRDDLGLEGTRMLSAGELAALSPVTRDGPRLDARYDDFWLAAEALRIRHAHQLNPLLAVAASNVEALPHQVQAVYDYLLSRHPQRFLLADDPGAGKTIMAGLYIKEALARDWVRRCLIVVPGSLAEQWQDELSQKFGLAFEIFDASMVEPSGGRPATLEPHPFLIARLDQFARNQKLADLIGDAPYDLAIFDEAHKLATRTWGRDVIKTRRFEFAERVRELTPSLLLMTATPHSGKEADYQRFLSLLRGTDSAPVGDAPGGGLMRRLVKEQLVHLDGSRLFPERSASTVGYHQSGLERDLYDDVSEYVRQEMNKVSGDESRRTVGFALLVLQRRLASSPQAILQSLTRRRDRLHREAGRLRDADRRLAAALSASMGLPRRPDDPDDLSPADAETYEDNTASVATAARTVAELETEIAILDRLVRKAEAVREAGVDAKWDALAGLLTSDQMRGDDGRRRKIIIFTEHRDTLEYLEDRLFDLLPAGAGIQVIHGLLSREDRRHAQLRFTEDPNSAILLATDAAGEGVNLQVAHLMVNYDIPWNPNRLDQRFGRIHRIGQKHSCHLWNLVALDTREGQVLTTLLAKLEIQRQALGDQVFDVLGQVLTDASLEQLLTRALVGEGGPDLDAVLDRVSSDLETAVRDRNAGTSSLTADQIAQLRTSMELSRAASFQPDMVRDFTLRAMATLQGTIEQHGQTWQARHVPEAVRSAGFSVSPRYAAITFERTEGPIIAAVVPELIAPGHPLLAALAIAVDDALGHSLRDGVLLDDDRVSEDYTILSVASDDEGSGKEPTVRTFAVAAGGTARPVDPALYASLSPAAGLATEDDLAAVSDAFTTLGLDEGADDPGIVAIARVRGSADAATAEAWWSARAALFTMLVAEHGRDHVVEALPGAGWDFMTTSGNAAAFFCAAPAGMPDSPRLAEVRAARNTGSAYVRRVMES